MINTIHIRLFYNFSITTALVFLSFGSFYLLTGKLILGGFEFSLGIIQLLNMILLYRYKKFIIATRILVASVYIMTFLIYIVGGLGKSGFLWIQFIPIFTMLILHHGESKYWALIYTGSLIIMITFHFTGKGFLLFSGTQIMQSVIVYTLCLILTYNNERLKAIDRKKLEGKNQMLEKLSQTDFLTGLYNRSYLNGALNDLAYQYNRYGRTYSLIMIDIDHFKKINDGYGHLRGDDVLVAISDTFKSITRKSDIIGRWGGEEFLILCYNTSIEAAGILAEKLRSAVASINFEEGFSVTASFGVTEVSPEHSISSILLEADNLLYKAKENGRNMVQY